MTIPERGGANGIILASLAIVLLIGLVAGSSTQIEADSLYNAAEGYFRSALYQDALDSAWLARERYAELNITEGIQKTDKVIGDIESVLTAEQTADLYYGIAGRYYLQVETGGNPDVTVLDRIISMASRARGLYSRVGAPDGSAGALRCDDLISKTNQIKDDRFRKCVMDADEMLRSSKESLLLNYFPVAKNLVVNATSLYQGCPYPAGVDKAASLLDSINSQISNITAQAKTSYGLALQAAASGDNKTCIRYANISQGLYNQVGDATMSAQAARAMTGCRSNIADWEESTRKQAELYFGDSQDFLITLDYPEAMDMANKANDLYQQLLDASIDAELGLPKSEQNKTSYYQFQMGKVAGLVEDIRQKWTDVNNKETAERFYQQAQTLYLNQDAQRAKSTALEARRIFEGLDDYVGVAKSDALIAQIDQLASKLSEAEGYLESARWEISVGDFADAISDAGKAKGEYASIRDTADEKMAQDLVSQATEGRDLLLQANIDLENANGELDAGRYAQALALATKARTAFISLNYSVGISESAKVMKDSSDLQAKSGDEFRRNAILVGAVALVAAIGVGAYARRRAAIEADFRRRIAGESERARRHEEELALRGDTEVKSKVEDELKRMIELERSKIERE